MHLCQVHDRMFVERIHPNRIEKAQSTLNYYVFSFFSLSLASLLKVTSQSRLSNTIFNDEVISSFLRNNNNRRNNLPNEHLKTFFISVKSYHLSVAKKLSKNTVLSL